MRLKDNNGGSLVEFAIILPLLLVLLFGIIEFGLLLYNQAVLTNASREGARYGIVARNPRYLESDIRDDVVIPYCSRMITFANPNDPIVTATHIDRNGNGIIDFGDDLVVLVRWRYNFLALPNLPGIGLNNPMNLSARTVMKYE